MGAICRPPWKQNKLSRPAHPRQGIVAHHRGPRKTRVERREGRGPKRRQVDGIRDPRLRASARRILQVKASTASGGKSLSWSGCPFVVGQSTQPVWFSVGR